MLDLVFCKDTQNGIISYLAVWEAKMTKMLQGQKINKRTEAPSSSMIKRRSPTPQKMSWSSPKQIKKILKKHQNPTTSNRMK